MMKAKVRLSRHTDMHCPSCGSLNDGMTSAPTRDDAFGICAYCATALKAAAGRLVIAAEKEVAALSPQIREHFNDRIRRIKKRLEPRV